MPDRTGQPVRASALTLLEPHLSRTGRMAPLAATALRECLREGQAEGAERLALVLALPEPGSGALVEEEPLHQALQEAAGPVRLEVPPGGRLWEGRAGFFRALERAVALLATRRHSRVLVGAVDSLCDAASLAHLARAGRTLGPGGRDGLIPGEGAGFFLLTSAGAYDRRGPSPRGWVVAHSLAEERNHFHQEEPNLAEGLTQALRRLRQHPVAGARRVDEILSCQTGEGYWAREFQWASLRNATLMPEPLVVRLAAEAVGDAGAAMGAVGLGLALYRTKRLEPAHGQPARVLVYGCSDSGRVGACVVEGET